MTLPGEESTALGHQFIGLSSDVSAAILRTLLDGWRYATASNDVTAGAGEVAMTERLRDGMRLALRSEGYPWSKAMAVLPGTESRSSSDVLIPDGRTDIPLFSIESFLRHGEHDPHAIIECKRIAGDDTHLCREYVVEGIDRFRSGKYGQTHSFGFMAGYLLSGTGGEAATGINAYLGRKSRDVDYLREVEASGVSTWRSDHARPVPRPSITLSHAFLEITVAA